MLSRKPVELSSQPTRRCTISILPRSIRLFAYIAALLIGGLILAGCSTPAYTSTPATVDLPPRFSVTVQSGLFTVAGVQGDEAAVSDIAQALLDNAAQVCADLDHTCQSRVLVEIFPDQVSLDRHGMNPKMQGYSAYSGNGRIQMVSPRQPNLALEFPYAERVLIAAHEFAHLALNEVNPTMPLWMNEGAAIFIGPHGVYRYVCQNRFPFERIPALRALTGNYAATPAADLFAFTFFDFLVSEYGPEALNRLIRSPSELQAITQSSQAELERGWHEFMKREYAYLGKR